MGEVMPCLVIVLVIGLASSSTASHEAPPHVKSRNSVLAAVQEASVDKLLTIDDDFLHAPSSVAVYTCINNIKYTMVDCPAITCLPNGTWSGPQPKCEPMDSQAPSVNKTDTKCSEPAFNKSMTASFLTKTIVAYHCNKKSHQLVGCPVLVCSNGSWTGTAPSCVALVTHEIEVIIRPMAHHPRPIPYNTTRGAFDPLTTTVNSGVRQTWLFLVNLLPLVSFLLF